MRSNAWLVKRQSNGPRGEGEPEAGVLSGGPAAVAMHRGSYDDLLNTHAAVDEWIEENGFRAEGGPWEIYISDPGEVPNPSDWETKIL